jgi:hypothetical protein
VGAVTGFSGRSEFCLAAPAVFISRPEPGGSYTLHHDHETEVIAHVWNQGDARSQVGVTPPDVAVVPQMRPGARSRRASLRGPLRTFRIDLPAR